MLAMQQPGKQGRSSDPRRTRSHAGEWALVQGSDGHALSDGILEVGWPAKEAGYGAVVLQRGPGECGFLQEVSRAFHK